MDILLRKDQVDMKDNDKNIKMLKVKLWIRMISIEAKIAMFRENQIVEETILLEEIQKNNMKEQEVQKELEKDDSQAWKDNRVIYIKGKIYIPNNQKIQEQILQDNHKLVDIRQLGQQRMLELIKRNY